MILRRIERATRRIRFDSLYWTAEGIAAISLAISYLKWLLLEAGWSMRPDLLGGAGLAFSKLSERIHAIAVTFVFRAMVREATESGQINGGKNE